MKTLEKIQRTLVFAPRHTLARINKAKQLWVFLSLEDPHWPNVAQEAMKFHVRAPVSPARRGEEPLDATGRGRELFTRRKQQLVSEGGTGVATPGDTNLLFEHL